MSIGDAILNKIRSTRHNAADLAEIGRALGLRPAELLPAVEQLRREWLITGSVREGRGGVSAAQREYTTADGIGIVAIRGEE